MTETSVVQKPSEQPLLGRITGFFVYILEKIMPDPYVFAVLLTFLGALLAWKFAPIATPASIAAAWYAGLFNIFTFAFQMVIMLVAGYALATSPAVHKALAKIAALATTPMSAVSLTLFVSLIASWLNWGGTTGARDCEASPHRLWLAGCGGL
jgi:short-chain fatty acids transporter